MRATKCFWLLPMLAIVTASALVAQEHDPRHAHMKPEFENDQVRVLRLKIEPHGKIPRHQMPGHVTVWLTDTRLKVTLPNGKTQMAQFKAGDVQWTEGGRHEGENLADTPIEAVLIEAKPQSNRSHGH